MQRLLPLGSGRPSPAFGGGPLDIVDPDSGVISGRCRFVRVSLINLVLCKSVDPSDYISDEYEAHDGSGSLWFMRGTDIHEVKEKFRSPADTVRGYFAERVQAIREESPWSNLTAEETQMLIDHVLAYRQAVLDHIDP